MDICINNDSGLRTGQIMRKFVRDFPPMRPLCMLLKMFLSQRKLHETYTGGIGSFVLVNDEHYLHVFTYVITPLLILLSHHSQSIMIVSFLQHRKKICKYNRLHKNTWNLGSLLIEFFYLYGIAFNYNDVGISVLNDGEYFNKRKRDASVWINPSRPQMLSIENPDPLTPNTDLGRNSYLLPRIKRSFEHAHQLLTAAMKDVPNGPYLSYVVRSDDPILANRTIDIFTDRSNALFITSDEGNADREAVGSAEKTHQRKRKHANGSEGNQSVSKSSGNSHSKSDDGKKQKLQPNNHSNKRLSKVAEDIQERSRNVVVL